MAKATVDLSEQSGAFKSLPLSAISLDPITDVRIGTPAKDEAEKIKLLADTITEQGQLQPIIVRPNGSEGTYKIIAGRRRFAAKQLLNAESIDAIVLSLDDEQAYAAALQENLARKQFSPMELAATIKNLVERNEWTGSDWAAKVADYLHVSRATVTQHRKLLDAPRGIQDDLHKGKISAQAALDLLKVESESQEEVAAKAKELAAAEEATSSRKGVGKGGKGKSNDSSPVSGSKKGTPETAAAPKVQSKHVAKAVRELDANVSKDKPRNRTEIIAFFEEILDSADPYPQPIVDFCKQFTKKWAAGIGTDRMLLNKLNVISELIESKVPPAKRAKAS